MGTPTQSNPTGNPVNYDLDLMRQADGGNTVDVGPQPSDDDGVVRPVVLNGSHPGAVMNR